MEQIQLRDLLRDPIYKKWFLTPPTRGFPRGRSAPWFVYVQKTRGGGWARAEFEEYKDALRFVAKHIKEYHDMAISHKRIESQPPVVKKKAGFDKKGNQLYRREYYIPITAEMVGMPDKATHKWCTFCRRPTVFGFFTKHHALTAAGVQCTGYIRRCTICSASEHFIRRYP